MGVARNVGVGVGESKDRTFSHEVEVSAIFGVQLNFTVHLDRESLFNSPAPLHSLLPVL